MRIHKALLGWMVIALFMAIEPQPVQAQPADPDQLTVILVMDNSGSMEVSDPDDLRFTAVRLFISLLDDGDEVGLILFSTHSQPLTDGLFLLGGEKDKQILLQQIQFSDPDGFTDFQAALVDAKEMVEPAQEEDGKIVLVLLTDGKPEIPQPYAAYEQETLDLAGSIGVPILAIALTSEAQTPFLARLATETGGAIIPAHEASNLLDVYLGILGQVKDRTVVGSGDVSAPGQASLVIDPALAPYIQKASFILSKTDDVHTSLLDPSGHVVDASSPNIIFTHGDDRFVVITVEEPAAGTWFFDLDGYGKSQARLVLHSRLRVRLVSPGKVHPAGESMLVTVQMVEEVEDQGTVGLVGEVNFSALITLPDGSQESLDQFYDDGTHGDVQAEDGLYSRQYVNTTQSGEYLIIVSGWKGAVPVSGLWRVNIIPFPKLVVDEPAGEYEIQGQPVTLRVHLEGGNPNSLDSGSILARMTAPSGTTTEIALQEEDGSYSGVFQPMESGVYRVSFHAQDAVYQGLPYQADEQVEFTVHLIRRATIGSPESDLFPACFADQIELPLTVVVSSVQVEHIALSLKNLAGWTLEPAGVELEPGNHSVVFVLKSSDGNLVEGEYPAWLVITGDEGLEIQPGAEIPLQIAVPSIWVRCRKPIGWGAAAGLGLALIGTAVALKVRAAKRPPLVTGTLRHWAGGNGSGSAADIDLTAMKKNVLLIGRGEACDLVIAALGLEEEHAALRAERCVEGLRVLLEPKGDVRKGYASIAAPIPLHHGDTFCMGGYAFQYLSDTGG